MKQYLPLLLSLVCFELTAQSPAYKDTTFTEYFRRTSGWTASDATISVPLPSGKTVWLFGDTHINGYNAADTTIPCLFQVRNSMMVQDLHNPEDFITILDSTQTGINRTPVKLMNDDTTYFWPGHGYAKGDTAIIFWQQYSGANYIHIANYFTKIYTPGFDDASAITELTQLPIPAGIEFGISVVVDSVQNYIYLYGHEKDWIILRPYVARFPLGEDVTESWEFYAGNGNWSSDVGDSQQLMASTNDYVSPSYSVIKLQGKYYMISQDIGFLTCGLGRDIYSWESDTPYGPFTNKKTLYTIEDKLNGEYMITYNATAHPEFIKDNELLISYNVNGTCPSECEGNPFTQRRNADGYRPKFIRVPLTYMDPELNVPDAEYGAPTVTGLNPTPMTGKAQLFPNPGKTGEFTLQLKNQRINVPAQVTVTHINGKVVHQEKTTKPEINFTLKEQGIYFVKIRQGNYEEILRLVVK